MPTTFQDATATALTLVAARMAVQAETAQSSVAERQHTPLVAREVNARAIAAVDVAEEILRAIMLARVRTKARTAIVYRFSAFDDIIAFALSTLRALSPVGGAGDKHPGLYRDSHTVFVNGVARRGQSARPGDVVHISNLVPYARKIEQGRLSLRLPPHVYERATALVADKYGRAAQIRFVYMPVRSGAIAAHAEGASRRPVARRKPRAVRDWLARQPAIEIRLAA